MADIRCVWWNTKNLFPYVAANAGKGSWPRSPDEYLAKLEAVAAALRSNGEVPDLVLLCEVANKDVAGGGCDVGADLAYALGAEMDAWTGGRAFADSRGIGFAALWRRSAVTMLDEPTAHAAENPLIGAGQGRPVTAMAFRPGGSARAFTAYLNHWTSRMDGRRDTEGKRIWAAQTLLSLLQDRLVRGRTPSADPDALIFAVGDFNDEPFNASLTWASECEDYLAITRERGSVVSRAPSAALPLMYNPMWRLLGEVAPTALDDGADLEALHRPAGSYYLPGSGGARWGMLDQVLVSAGMLKGDHPIFREETLRVHCPPSLRNRKGHPTGPSDHFALHFDLRFND